MLRLLAATTWVRPFRAVLPLIVMQLIAAHNTHDPTAPVDLAEDGILEDSLLEALWGNLDSLDGAAAATAAEAPAALPAAPPAGVAMMQPADYGPQPMDDTMSMAEIAYPPPPPSSQPLPQQQQWRPTPIVTAGRPPPPPPPTTTNNNWTFASEHGVFGQPRPLIRPGAEAAEDAVMRALEEDES
jgi:hypothetical protein